MQLKNLGNSINAINDIQNIISSYKGMNAGNDIIQALQNTTKGYSTEVLKLAIAQTTLDETQIKAILTAKGLKGQILETTTAELAQATSTNALSISQKTATGTTTGLSTAFKGLTASIKSFVVANPGIAIAAIATAAIAAGVAVYTKLHPSLEKATADLKEQKETFESVSQEVSDLSDELQTAKDRLEELQSKGSLSLVENEELAKLKETTAELETQLAIKMQEQKLEAKKTADIADKAFNGGFRSKYDDNGELITGDAVHSNDAVKELENSIKAYYKLLEEYNSAKKNADFFIKESEKNGGMFDAVGKVDYAQYEKYAKQMEALQTQMDYASIQAQTMYAAINGQKEAYEGLYQAGYDLTQAQLQEYETVRQSANAYNDFCADINNVEEAFEKLDATQKRTRLETDFVLSGQSEEKAKEIVESIEDEDLDVVYSLTFNATDTKESVHEAIEVAKDELNKTQLELDIEEPDQWDYSTTITQLDTIKEKFDVLDSTLSKLYDEDSSIGFKDFSSINEAFSDLDNIEHYIQRLQEAGQDTEAVTAVMEDLIGSYLEYSGVLDNVTDENRQLITSMLEEMGVANAEAVVNGILTTTTAEINAAKQALGITTENLADLTLEEIQRLIEEGNCSEQTKNKLYELYLTQIDLNNNPIDATVSINQLLSMVDASSAAGTALTQLASIMGKIGQLQQYMSTTDGEISQSLAKNTLSMLEKQAANIKANALAEFSKTTTATPSIKVNPTADYKGGSSTQKAIEDAAEAAKKAAEEVKEAFEETFDFFDQRVKVLDNALELLKTNVDNVTGAFAKNNLIDAELSITEEKFKNYTDALSMYTEKANEALSKLPSDIAAKIKDGAVDLTTFIGDGNEEVVEAIKDYQNWADKIADCKQELAELKTAIRQLELEKFNNIMEDFTNQFDLREDGKDLITKQIELLKEAGQLIGESFYTTQIEQSKKQLSTLEEEKAKLVEQMTSAISSGRVIIMPSPVVMQDEKSNYIG